MLSKSFSEKDSEALRSLILWASSHKARVLSLVSFEIEGVREARYRLGNEQGTGSSQGLPPLQETPPRARRLLPMQLG